MNAQVQRISGVTEETSETENCSPGEVDELIIRARLGDEAAFEQLVRTYGKQVLGIAARFFRQADVREDIAQEVFIKVYQSLDMFQLGEPLSPWLTKITVNTCYDHLRRLKRRRELKFSEITKDEAIWLDQQQFGESMDAFEKQRSRDIAAGLAERILLTLPPTDRLVLLLYERDGLTTAEIAQTMGWSRAKVKVRLFRSRRALHRTLERLLDPPSVGKGVEEHEDVSRD